MAGEVGEINTALESDAALVNRDPYGDGWMVKLKISGPDALKGLMSPSEYRTHIGE
jgi:glycine cleavage system H protein